MNNSKFKQLYDSIKNNIEIQKELNSLKGKNFTAKLRELFPNDELSHHCILTVKKILKDINASSPENITQNYSKHASTDNKKVNDSTSLEKIKKEDITSTMKNDENYIEEDLINITDNMIAITAEEETPTTPTVLISAEDAAKYSESTKHTNELLNQIYNLNNQISSLERKLALTQNKLSELTNTQKKEIDNIFKIINSFPGTNDSIPINEGMKLAAINILCKHKIIDSNTIVKNGTRADVLTAQFAFAYLINNLSITE